MTHISDNYTSLLATNRQQFFLLKCENSISIVVYSSTMHGEFHTGFLHTTKYAYVPKTQNNQLNAPHRVRSIFLRI